MQNVKQEAFPGQNAAMAAASGGMSSPTNKMNLVGGVKWDPNDVSEIDAIDKKLNIRFLSRGPPFRSGFNGVNLRDVK